MRALAKLLILLGWLYGFIAVMAGSVDHVGYALAWLSMPITWFAAVLAHESGHLVVGLARGMRATCFTVYPFKLRLRPLRLTWVPRRKRRQLGGFVQFDSGPCRARDRSAMIIAGPGANMVLACVAAIVFVGAGWPSSIGGEAVALMSVSSTMAVANLLPSGTNDGAQLVAIWRCTRPGRSKA